MKYPFVHYRLYYTDSKGEKRYIHNSLTGEVLELHTERDALERKWAEAQRGSLYQIEYVVEHTLQAR